MGSGSVCAMTIDPGTQGSPRTRSSNPQTDPLRSNAGCLRALAERCTHRRGGSPMAGKGYHRLTALDNSFLVFERSNCHMHVASTAIFETGPLATPTGGVDIERVRAYIASRLHLIPRYRQRLQYAWFLDRPVWVDDDRFNLNYHV